MRIRAILAAAAAASLMAFPAMAQDGQYGPQLNRILAEAANGSCLAALMGESLLNACNGQIEGMGPALASLGAIESTTFVSAGDRPGGRVEIWAVKYAGGQTLNWVIGEIHDGKFDVVGTAG